ncbi:hypothetical protein [Vreelandella subglaciescola]|uniref:Protein refolding chaperone Spy/CpxP family n=1 Tax=Vreelandella subglaciescola TaxID=29571 RepID=A0A1M7HZP3_9GAMM|nr:hypothetical protein [Halomonas subglaciescola]SHM33793.1 hypothetical protein SAMN05878437_2445 [Halomonas subglaciescola]
MKSLMPLRKSFAPALLAAMLIPLAFAAQAAPDAKPSAKHAQGEMPAALKARMEERRQAVYEEAGIDEATQKELNATQQEHYEAMHKLRQEHRERMQEILTDEQQQSLNQAMRDLQSQHQGKQGAPGKGKAAE